VNSIGNPDSQGASPAEREPLPLSLLNNFLFCNRRAGLKIVEGLRRANVHTLIGDLVHEHADLPGYEIAKGVTLLRALPVWSERLGLNGKCDIVERHPDGSLVPVEYKKSKRRHFDNDDVQLCAQALCLEEMFARPVERGSVFHAASKRRREVAFTTELRAITEQTAADVHALDAGGSVPPAVLKPQCAECSLYEVCLPQLTSHPPALDRAMRRLFEAA
jgi:CRISPR-associated exonuclease Cas4